MYIRERLKVVPPADLTEAYFECTSDIFTALNNAIGIASGNTSTFFPIFLSCFLPVIYLYLKIIGHVHIKEEYSKEEREKAMEIFATNVLRARDGKSDISGKNQDFAKFAELLVKLAGQPSGEETQEGKEWGRNSSENSLRERKRGVVEGTRHSIVNNFSVVSVEEDDV